MSRSDASGLGVIPNATGTLTRLAYEYAKANGIEARPLLKRANLSLHQIKDTSLRLNVSDQIKFLNLAATELHDDFLIENRNVTGGSHVSNAFFQHRESKLYCSATSLKLHDA